MLQSPQVSDLQRRVPAYSHCVWVEQHKAYHEIALRNVLRLMAVASLRENQTGQAMETVDFLQNLLFPTISTLDGFSVLAANALEAMRPSALDLQLPIRTRPDLLTQPPTATTVHVLPELPAQTTEAPEHQADSNPDPKYGKGFSPTSTIDEDEIPLSPIEFDEKDDTLGDLVGALHSLNEFFSTEDDDMENKGLSEDARFDHEYDQTNEGRVRAILAVRAVHSSPCCSWLKSYVIAIHATWLRRTAPKLAPCTACQVSRL